MLFSRIISAIIGILILIFVIFMGGWVFKLALMLVALLGLFEFYSVLQRGKIKFTNIAGFVSAVLIFIVTDLNMKDKFFYILLITIIFLFILSILSKKYAFNDIMVTILGLVYPTLSFITILLISKIDYPINNLALALLFLLTWSSDTFAYFSGMLLGRHKLSPDLSPKKTIEGAVGGVIGTIIISVICWGITSFYYDFSISWYHFLVIGLMCGIFSQFGDLSASLIKRNYDAKDFGHIMPGHGGILDRFDSILFTAPLIYIYFTLLL